MKIEDFPIIICMNSEKKKYIRRFLKSAIWTDRSRLILSHWAKD